MNTSVKYPADVQPVLATDIFYEQATDPHADLDTKIDLPELPTEGFEAPRYDAFGHLIAAV